jgi:shikimate dehydrogenase
MKINDIFSTYGEDYFRKIESELILKYSKETNLVISCGGGVIKDENNILNLKSNGIVIYLTRDINKLIFSSNRPLTKNLEDYNKLKEQRENLYIRYKDYQVDNSSTISECVKEIKEIFYESINY